MGETTIGSFMKNRQSFGVISQEIMRCPYIKATAKALYCYLASFAGANQVAFPGVDRICREMDINVSTYKEHMSELKELGIVTVEQTRNESKHYSHNLYIIDCLPPNLPTKDRKDRKKDRDEKAEKTEAKQSNKEFVPQVVFPLTENKSAEKPPAYIKRTNNTKRTNINKKKSDNRDFKSFSGQKKPFRDVPNEIERRQYDELMKHIDEQVREYDD